VKHFKTNLEKATKLSRAFKVELTATEELMSEVQAELATREGSKIAKDVESELNWIKVIVIMNLKYIHRNTL